MNSDSLVIQVNPAGSGGRPLAFIIGAAFSRLTVQVNCPPGTLAPAVAVLPRGASAGGVPEGSILLEISESGFAAVDDQAGAAPPHTPFGQKLLLAGGGWVSVTRAADNAADADWADAQVHVSSPDSQDVRRYTLPRQRGEAFAVGRSRAAHIHLDDELVSSIHLRFFSDGNHSYSVEDNNSSNGTFLNGQRLAGRQPLRHGATLRVGGTLIEFTNVMDVAPLAPMPPEPAAGAPDDSTGERPAPAPDADPGTWLERHQSRLLIGLVGGIALILAYVGWLVLRNVR